MKAEPNMLGRNMGLKSPVYIAGPMRGYAGLNYCNFSRVTRLLRSKDYAVFSPHENFPPDPNLGLHDCMKTDLTDLLDCNSIVALEGWEASKGAGVEIFVADQCGIPVFHESDLERPLTLQSKLDMKAVYPVPVNNIVIDVSLVVV